MGAVDHGDFYGLNVLIVINITIVGIIMFIISMVGIIKFIITIVSIIKWL